MFNRRKMLAAMLLPLIDIRIPEIDEEEFVYGALTGFDLDGGTVGQVLTVHQNGGPVWSDPAATPALDFEVARRQMLE